MKRLVLILSFLALMFPAVGQNLGQFHRGLDSLDFVYEPLADKPIKLFYYIPSTGNVERMPVLISFHGAERLGINPIICWQEFAERDGFIILSPEFSRKYYNENGYQFGNVFKTRECKELNPEEKWVYSAIEPMFDFFKKETGNRAKTYSIQGHSAGGQFVHRYLLAKPDARVDIAVASNPGTWTWISDDGSVRDYTGPTSWPYTIKGTPFDDERHLKAYFNLGEDMKLGGAGMIMAIAGAAVLTQIEGIVSDQSGSIATAYWIPAIAFLVILFYSAFVCRKYEA